MKDKTVLVTGASGFLGRAIVKNFEESGWKVVGTGFSRADLPRILKIDLTDGAAVQKLIDEVNPSVIVNSAAERSIDVSQDPSKRDDVLRVNVQLPELLSKISREKGILLIQISTDYVFDGENPPYYPDSKTNPLNFYGESKLLAEQAAIAGNPDSTICLRVPVLYGAGKNNESAVNVILDSAMNNEKKPKIEVDNVANRFPTEIGDVSRVVRDIASLWLDNPKAFNFPEILHFSAAQRMTKYDMALKFAEILGVPSNHLVKLDEIDESTTVKRPLNAQLDVGRLRELGINTQTVDFESWWRRRLGAFRH